jgi:hypothetical protein
MKAFMQIRKLLLSLVFSTFVIVMLLSSSAYAQPLQVKDAPTPKATSLNTVYIRKNAHSPEARADIEALQKALRIMRDNGCGNPLSWYYQGGIHWVPPASDLPTNPLCPSYNQVSSQLKTAWNNCTHDKAGTSLIHFLSWHRFFINYFERIVRRLSGKSDFALPYWDYTSTTNVDTNRRMPAEFTIPPSQSFNNSLYEESRFRPLNAGSPIDSRWAEQNLNVDALFQSTDFETFNSTIDGKPHGVMHDYIGLGPGYLDLIDWRWNPIWQKYTVGGMMAWVETAGFDPIFWLHHSNIDRLWEKWTRSARGQRITLEQLNSVYWPYAFFDENGNPVVYTSQQVYNMVYNQDYVYDDLPAPRSGEEFATQTKKREKSLIAARNFQQPLSDTPTELGFPLTSRLEKKNSTLLREVAAISSPLEKSFVVELAVSFQGRPRGIYDVYVNLPNIKAISDRSAYYGGSLSFFMPEHDEKVTKTFRFDITDELIQQVKTREDLGDAQNLSFTIFKNGGSKDPQIVVEKVTLYQYKQS